MNVENIIMPHLIAQPSNQGHSRNYTLCKSSEGMVLMPSHFFPEATQVLAIAPKRVYTENCICEEFPVNACQQFHHHHPDTDA
jgi:hypothetical protein